MDAQPRADADGIGADALHARKAGSVGHSAGADNADVSQGSGLGVQQASERGDVAEGDGVQRRAGHAADAGAGQRGRGRQG